ncbi:MAG: hypothetical protein QOK29_2082 [Rhodospirillaceae bacterium]|nr:hypothetical protein [Rhodospirillaceae bacterium]
MVTTSIVKQPAGIVEDSILAYKPFLDGLRALSIIAVVAYHIRIPGFAGGYVGVDVFFVISGFLIINQIATEIPTGKFSIADFYARRVLRILPPLLVVLFACTALASFVLVMPREYLEFGHSLTASTLMVANHYFLQHQDYFDTPGDLQPLLHTWTLSVEEQFYLVTPFLLLGAAHLAGRRPALAKALRWGGPGFLWLLSLTGCILLTGGTHNLAFYFMPLRGWEFIAGGAIALAIPAAAKLERSCGAIAVLGLAGIVTAASAYGPELNYPSAWALLPVGGAAAVILAGVVAPKNIVARLLATRPLVGIGLVSYSWYLWHWPLLAFSRIWEFGGHSNDRAIAIGLVSLILAVVTYVAIERPARRWRRRLGARGRWRVVFGGALACLLLGSSGVWTAHVVAPRVADALPASLLPADVQSEIDPNDPCVIRSMPQLDPRCVASAGAMKFGLLMGDSHALAIYSMLSARLKDENVQLVFLASLGCSPVVANSGAEHTNTAGGCGERNAAGLRSIELLLGNRLSFAIIAAKWASYVIPPPAGPDPVFDQAERILTYPMRQFALEAGRSGRLDSRGNDLAPTMQRLAGMGVQRVLLVGPVPPAPGDVPSCLVRAYLRHVTLDGQCAYARPQVEAQMAPAVAMLRTVVRRFGNARYADPIDVFCDRILCRPYDGAVTLFVDNNHLSRTGAERLYVRLRPDIDWTVATEIHKASNTQHLGNSAQTP